MSTYSLVLDLITLAVLLLCAAYYARRGFIAGVFSFFGTAITIVGAGLAAYYLSPALFNAFLREGLKEQVTEVITQQGIYNAETLLAELLSFLPHNLLIIITSQLDLSAINFAAADVAGAVVDQALAPLITPFIMIMVFLIVSGLVRVLLGVVRSLAVGFTKLPAMNTVNSALGGAAGVLIGLLYVYIGISIIWAYDMLNPQQALQQLYFSNSITMQLLNPLNLFTRI